MQVRKDTIIAIDAGNSTVRVALICGGEIGYNATFSTTPLNDLQDRLTGHAGCLSAMRGAERVVVSSVCPEANGAVTGFGESLSPEEGVFFLSQRHIPLPVSGDVSYPERVGVDRLLCGYAALQLYGRPCVVVGAGTAITVDLIDDSGVFAGGAIAPGLRTAARALSESASNLPSYDVKAPIRACGRDTEEAVLSGVYHFCREGTFALVRKYSETCKGCAQLIITGGDAELLEPPGGRFKYSFNPGLLLKGIWLVSRKI